MASKTSRISKLISNTRLEKLKQPILKTPRLILDAPTEADLPDVLAYASDARVAEFVTWPPHQSLEDSRRLLEFRDKNYSEQIGKLFFIWAIRLQEHGRMIGSIDFKQPYPHVGQFDYSLGFAHWGKGIMTEAGRAVIDWAFANLPMLERFQAFCIAENLGSRRVMEKCGLEFEGIRRKAMAVKGRPVDLAYYARVSFPQEL